MPSRSRDRHLAKLAERRRAERTAAARRRNLIVGGIVGVIVLVVAAVGAAKVLNESGPASATSTGASGSATPSGSASPSSSNHPGQKVGTVRTAAAPAKVACGAAAPPTATKPKPQFAGPVPMAIDPKKTYTATMATSCGTIVLHLDSKGAPLAVNNFVFLAQHHLYDGTWFHRIAPKFVIQGGDPKGDGTGDAGYKFDTETNPTTKFADSSGLVAYANSGPNTNGSQFFITLTKLPSLDPPNGPYTIFGKVTQGFAVVKMIAAVPTTANPGIPGEKSTPLEAVYIDSLTISVSR